MASESPKTRTGAIALSLPKGLKQELPPEIFIVQDHADEDQIMAEMRGEALKDYIYEFTIKNGPQTGQVVRGLSISGVRHAIRAIGNVKVVPCECCKKAIHVEEHDGLLVATAVIWDMARNVQFTGTASAYKTDKFAWTLAANKAERNAQRKLLPEKFIADMIDSFVKQGGHKKQLELATAS